MATKTHTVPQNILDVEFKLFGSLTIRQFGYVAGAALFVLFMWSILDINSLGIQIFRYVFCIISAIVGLLMAFGQVGGLPFDQWFLNYIFALFTEQRSVYKKSQKANDILDRDDILTSGISKGDKSSAALKNRYIDQLVSVPDNIYMSSARSEIDLEEERLLSRFDKLIFNNNQYSIPTTSNMKIAQNIATVIDTEVVPINNQVTNVWKKENIITPVYDVVSNQNNIQPQNIEQVSPSLDSFKSVIMTDLDVAPLKVEDNDPLNFRQYLPTTNISPSVLSTIRQDLLKTVISRKKLATRNSGGWKKTNIT